MQNHYFRQSGFTVAGRVADFISPVQTYKCENCGEEISLPDCYHVNGKKNNFCLSLMMLGCKNDKERPKLPPRKEKAVWEDKKDYPKKRGKT